MSKDKKELAKKLTKEMQQADQLSNLEEMLKNNVIEFELNGTTYRVRKPTIKERQEVRKEKNKKYLELLNDDNYLFREQIIEKLEKKGKSIAKMVEAMNKIQEQIERLQLKLAEYGNAKEKDNKIITDLKLKIFELMEERNLISINKSDLLSGSIEDTLLEFETTYFAYLLLEKKEGDNWIRVFNKYDDFLQCQDNSLMSKCGNYLGLLLFSSGE
jgi:NAD-specific glutamate dehydrogenase